MAGTDAAGTDAEGGATGALDNYQARGRRVAGSSPDPAGACRTRQSGTRRGAAFAPRRVGAVGGAARPDRHARGAGARRACPSWCRSATGGCRSRRSRSSAARRYVMAPTSPHAPPGLAAQLCGDAHLSNFGVFASPERELVFDVNDFDETLPGPFEWDVKRLAASVAVAGRERGFTDAAARASDRGGRACAYREAMRALRGDGQARRLVRAPRRRRVAARASSAHGQREAAQARRQERRQGASARTACAPSRS